MFTRLNHWLVVCFIVIVAVVVYISSLQNGFCGDDKYLIVKNDFIKSSLNLSRIFQKSYTSTLETLAYVGQSDIGSGEVSARQVCTLSFFLDYSIWGMNPFGYHVTNLLLHIINALLIYFLALGLKFSWRASFFCSLIFLLHPVNNEVVALITSRDDSVMFLFYGTSLLLYQRFRETEFQKIKFLISSLVLYVFALFSKESAVTLPFIIIVLDYFFPVERFKRFSQRIRFYLPYCALVGLYLYVWFFVMPPDRAGVVDYFMGDVLSVGATIISILAIYVKWLIIPWNIPFAIADPELIVKDFTNVLFLLSFVEIFLIGFLLFFAVKYKRKRILFAFAWGGMTLVPVLPLPLMLNILCSPRFVYVPMIGFCFLMGAFWDFIEEKYQRPVILYIPVIALLAFYSVVTIKTLPAWKDNVTLNLERLQDYPSSSLAYLNAGKAFEDQGMSLEARYFYEQALQLNPRCIECQNELGSFLAKTGDAAGAEIHFRRSLAIDPHYELAKINLCNSLGQQRKLSQAEVCFQDFLSRYPKSAQAYYNIGIFYAENGNINEAYKVWQYGLQIDPQNVLLRKVSEHRF